MRARNQVLLTAAIVCLGLSRPALSQAQAADGDLKVPLKMTAWAINMGNTASGANGIVEIRVEKWSTSEERQQLIGTFLEKGQDGLLRALEKVKAHGRIRVPGAMGPGRASVSGVARQRPALRVAHEAARRRRSNRHRHGSIYFVPGAGESAAHDRLSVHVHPDPPSEGRGRGRRQAGICDQADLRQEEERRGAGELRDLSGRLEAGQDRGLIRGRGRRSAGVNRCLC